ncbi:hypothetical protein BVC80_1751g130 [Macleaya cordata]|uniref:Uncharacterized protein n=1 Tax=Macleaya cordata TaxID=56857 RepID=A0A200QHN1_MACCD|nr:hypothetical protein BVC80_1751g130 [Macleaya cordata]
MNLLRNVIKSNALLGIKPNQARLHFLLRESPRHFSTETEDQPQQQQQNQESESPVDPFLRPPNQGLIYGKLSGTGRFTMKTDIINMLEGCNLTPQDIKVEYNRYFAPLGMLVQFPSRSAFDNAVRVLGRKGRLFRLDKVDRSQWEIESYDGKAVLMQGIPRNALPEDVERFLSGCDFNTSNMQLLMRQAFPDPIRLAVVQFPSQVDAMNAVLVKNRNFCLNNQILMRVLQ